MRRLVFMVWKELLELRQDKRMLPIVFVAPILQLIVLGYAATTDVKNVPIVVVDSDRSTASRELIRTFDASPYFTVETVVAGVNEITPYLESGRAWMALNISAGYGQAVGSGHPTKVQIVADGTDAQLDERSPSGTLS